MKRFLHNFKKKSVCQLRVLIVPVLFLLFANFASAQQTTAIPDENFEQALIDLGIDTDPIINGTVLTSAISTRTTLDISTKGISNLAGIEAFSSLQTFNCSNNSITALDLTMLVNLQTFNCSNNSITALDLTMLANLTELYCNNNQLTSLDVRGLTLTNFECLSNPLSTSILIDDLNVPTLRGLLWRKEGTATYANSKCNDTYTWNGTAWSPGVPTNVECAAVISGPYNRSGDIKAFTLTIQNNAIVTIPSGSNVTLSAALTVTPGSSFTLSNNANLVQTNRKTVNSGNISVKRDSSPLFRLDYTMWSSPVTGQTLGAFSPSTLSDRFYNYNSDTNLYNSIPPTGTFSTSKGYLIRMPDNWVDVATATPANWTGTFTGVPNNGDINFEDISKDKFTAVGNPYPSTLNIDKFIDGNNQIDGTLWFWRKTNNPANLTSYSTCNKAGCTVINGHTYTDDNFISAGQGFIIKGTASSKVRFDNSMRVANNQNQFFKTKKIEKNRIWLNLSMGSNPVNQMLVAYMAGATQGIDRAIDGRYINDSQTALNSLINNEEFAIQGRSLPFDATDVVPLAFKTTTDGNYNIAIDQVDGLFAGNQDIYLLDSKTGSETNLKTTAYSFTATAGVDNTRFSLKFQKTLGLGEQALTDNSVIVYKNNGVIYVNSGAKTINNIKVFDIQGRLIAEQNSVKANTTSIQNLKASNQIVIVKVTTDDNQEISKKVEN